MLSRLAGRRMHVQTGERPSDAGLLPRMGLVIAFAQLTDEGLTAPPRPLPRPSAPLGAGSRSDQRGSHRHFAAPVSNPAQPDGATPRPPSLATPSRSTCRSLDFRDKSIHAAAIGSSATGASQSGNTPATPSAEMDGTSWNLAQGFPWAAPPPVDSCQIYSHR